MEAAVKTAGGEAVEGNITIVGPGNMSMFVASVSASGGVGDYTYAGISVAGETLHVSDKGEVYIPATLSPPTAEAMTLTFAVAADDSGDDANLTRGARAQMTVVYFLGQPEPLAVSMQFLGMAAEGEWAEKGGVHYHLSETPLAERRAAAILHVSGGIPPYAYSRTSGDLEVDGSTVYLPAGIVTRIRSVGGLGYHFADVLVKDSASSAATIAAKPGALFVGVDRHGGLMDFNRLSHILRARASSEPITLTRVLLPHKTRAGELTKMKGEMDIRDIPDPAYSDNNFYHLPRYPIFIPAGVEPGGQTLSIVLRASDGDSNARARTRPDRLYTISVRLIRKMSAELRTQSGGRVQGAITIRRVENASVFVASVFANGGVGNYSYTGISVSGQTLHVDSDGVIFIPSTLSPPAGDGITATFAVRTDDRGRDDERTDSTKVSLTLVYVSGADVLQVRASDAEGNVIPDGDVFAAKGTIRVYLPADLPEDMTLAKISASGGTPPYHFRTELAGVNLDGLEFRNGAVVIPAGSSWNQFAPALIVHAEDSDNRTGRLTVRAKLRGVHPHGALNGFIASDPGRRVALDGLQIAVRRAASSLHQVEVAELIALDGANIVKEKGDLEFTSPNILIRSNTPPDGRTLSIVLRAANSGDNGVGGLRPDRLYTVSVRYFQPLVAELKTKSGGRFPGGLTVFSLTKASVFVASVSASGGIGDYTYAGVSVSGATLHVDSSGVISIPATLPPLVGGNDIVFAVDADDSAEGSDNAPAIRLRLTLSYVFAPPPPLLEARDLAGNAVPGGDFRSRMTAYFYHQGFSDAASSHALSEELTLATLSASSGTPPYAYAKTGSGGGLIVRDGLVLAPAGFPVNFAAPDVALTAQAEDSIGQRGLLTVRAKIKGVAPHGNLSGFKSYTRLPIANAEALNMIDDNGAIFVNNPAGATLSKESGGLVFHSSPTSENIPLIRVPDSAPVGITLSLVLRATDGAGTAERRARPDRLYTIAVRVIDLRIRAEALRADGVPFGEHGKIVVGQGGASVFVASIAAFGGEGRHTYTARRDPGKATLHVDSNGVVYIPATVSPLPGDGVTIGVAVDVDDARTRNHLPGRVRLSIRATYVLGAADALAAHVFNFNRHRRAPLTAPDSPYYRIQMTQREGDISGSLTFVDALPVRLAERTPLAAMTLSGGTPPYAIAMSEAEGTGLELDGGTLYMSAGDVSHYDAWGLKILATDSASPPASLTMVFDSFARLQQPIGELQGSAPGGGALPRGFLNGGRALVVASPGDSFSPLTMAVSLRADLATGLTRIGSGGLFLYTTQKLIWISPGTVPRGQTLSVVVRAFDGDDSEDARLRQDRAYTINVLYLPEISLAMKDASGGALDNPLEIVPSASTGMVVASVSAGGGVGNYTYKGIAAAGATLHVNSSGVISIPESVATLARPGMQITFAVEVNDAGENESATKPARITLTVAYISGGTLQLAVRDLRGNLHTDGKEIMQAAYIFNKNFAEDISGPEAPLSEAMLAATLTASGGVPPYTYARVGEAGRRNLFLRDGAVLMSAGQLFYRGVTELRITAWAVDSAGATGLLTMRTWLHGVAWHTELSGRIPGGGAANFDSAITVFRERTSSSPVAVAQRIQVSHRHEPSLLVAVRGGLILRGRPGGYRLLIPAHTKPDGRTFFAVLRATDGDNNEPDRARPDRLYTVSVRYLRSPAAHSTAPSHSASPRAIVRPASESGLFSYEPPPLLSLTSRAAGRKTNDNDITLTVAAASASDSERVLAEAHASGGDGGLHTIVQQGEGGLHYDSASGKIVIPASTAPANQWLSITLAVADKDAPPRSPANVKLTVFYWRVENLPPSVWTLEGELQQDE